MRSEAATFIGGPWDLHRVVFPTHIGEPPTYEVPMLDLRGISVHVQGMKEELIPMRRAIYQRFKLPDPSGLYDYIVFYLFERETL